LPKVCPNSGEFGYRAVIPQIRIRGGNQIQVWRINPIDPEPEIILSAAGLLTSGALVAFPTETVYGLGANAFDGAAVGRIFAAKGRPANNPVIVHVAEASEARLLVSAWTKSAQLLADRFWPGPLTMVLRRSSSVPDVVTGGGSTVAMRCPAHPVARALVRAAGPVAAPSANRSGELSPTLPEHVLRALSGRIDGLLDGGPTPAGIESTVIDVSGAVPRLLRPGPVPLGEIEKLLGPIERASFTSSSAGPLPSPGLMARHYAPRTALECSDSLERIRQRAEEIASGGGTVGIVTTEDPGPIERARSIILPARPGEYAAALYRVLHELDQQELSRIVVLLPPETDEWLAVRDRLRRAASTHSD
jgi:L-threonylcarbamoyladenylate synthase